MPRTRNIAVALDRADRLRPTPYAAEHSRDTVGAEESYVAEAVARCVLPER
jgi:hypothetical protein